MIEWLEFLSNFSLMVAATAACFVFVAFCFVVVFNLVGMMLGDDVDDGY